MQAGDASRARKSRKKILKMQIRATKDLGGESTGEKGEETAYLGSPKPKSAGGFGAWEATRLEFVQKKNRHEQSSGAAAGGESDSDGSVKAERVGGEEGAEEEEEETGAEERDKRSLLAYVYCSEGKRTINPFFVSN